MNEDQAAAGSIRVLACQITIPPIDSASARDTHVKQVADKIHRSLEREPADLVVLPELSTLSYSRATFDKLGEVAEPPEGPSLKTFAELAIRHRTHVAFGLARVSQDRFFISHAIVNPDGECVGHYDKLHMAQFGASMEKEYFSAGDHLTVFELNGTRVAPIICYDFRFPDLVATLCRKHDVKLVLHPVAFYRDRSFPSWHSIVVARAVENQVYYLSLNRAGDEFGNSLWCPPWIDDELRPKNFGSKEALEYFTVDSSLVGRVREEFSFTKDRLPDYAALDVDLSAG